MDQQLIGFETHYEKDSYAIDLGQVSPRLDIEAHGMNALISHLDALLYHTRWNRRRTRAVNNVGFAHTRNFTWFYQSFLELAGARKCSVDHQ